VDYRSHHKSDRSILLNCFALGCWATGMNASMALADVAIFKSIGCDRQKLENSLKTFGTDYRYLIFGYPPFIKSFLDNTTLDMFDRNCFEVVVHKFGTGVFANSNRQVKNQYIKRHCRSHRIDEFLTCLLL
jgi:phenylacetate-CoA ligase